MSITKMVVGSVGGITYNAANVVCDVEQFLGRVQFEYDPALLQDAAKISYLALLPVLDVLKSSDLGVQLQAICRMLDHATKARDDKFWNQQRSSIIRVCRAALHRLLNTLNDLGVYSE